MINKDRKLIRRGSLKKTVAESSGSNIVAMRPSSKGKLNSIKVGSFNGDILGVKVGGNK
jgi:hypothetical protein